MAKKSRKRKRSTSEKVMIVLGILIAISMLLSLFVGLGSSGRNNSPLPENERFEPALEGVNEPIGANDAGFALPVAGIPVGALAPPLA